MKILLADTDHLESLSILFDQYRVFYGQVSDIKAAKEFLKERFQHHDSVVFVAQDKGEIIGFTQLYPSFSSVSMKRVWILNDLYVKESHRRQKVATLLINAAQDYAKQSGAVRIVLATHISNTTAQKLYESQGYIKDVEFDYYALRLQ
ncbi:GNAT family N-acetyltransferase [Tolypothrix sp. PCC 7910]|uniref:GNAT family N-acetyltransferase n=1 Tax=Tolypothrix sp. PCC 7910 TaxID=2099387 RepID=UPI0014277570|nr:GNAT family N-acetyltransferase [Tolypothrix sp. PCC 7910]QIR37597.1 GNAT family N-acetyltransferase [Tolypothrix sp. PCC 7910]